VTLHVNNNLCLFKHGKKITPRYDISDWYTNGTIDLGQFFQRLDKQAGINKICKLKVSPLGNIFEKVSIDNFKNMGKKIIEIIESSATQSGDRNQKQGRTL